MTPPSGHTATRTERMTACAASALLARLFDDTGTGADVSLTEAARSRVSVHYETGDATVPVLCVATREAVRLPNTVVSDLLPEDSRAVISDGRLHAGSSVWRVARWWQPLRPSGLQPSPDRDRLLGPMDAVRAAGGPLLRLEYDALVPAELVGAGPGLTPCGDDVLAGALVTARATGDPRHEAWGHATRRALAVQSTTAVSRALLQHALDGYATPELAGFLGALCQTGDPGPASRRLLAVGHTSGAALATGVLHALATRELEEPR